MRDSNSWIKTLRKQLNTNITPNFANFARIELMLYALQAYFPEQPIRKAHLLMQGYREPKISDLQWEIVKHLRHLASEFHSSISWEIALRNYDEIAKGAAAGWLGFEIDYENNRITLTNNMVTNRYEVYDRVLTKDPLQFDKKKYDPAPKGDYQFNLNSEQVRVVRISEAIANIGKQHQANIPHAKFEYHRQPIRLSFNELIQKGRELQSVLGYNAGEILERSHYWDIQNERQTQEIIIDGESHILGPTGSGKSTLIECLITLLIEKGKRIAIAANSVGEVQDWLEFAQKIGIKAVPIIGNSERHKHLSRLNQAVMFTKKKQPFTHPGFKWLSQCCPLFAISTPSIRQSTSNRRNQKPCFGKLEDVNNPKKKKYDCPLVAVCSQHITARELEEAQLIIGTLPGFIHKKISSHNLTENITILEYLALTTDLFVVDEVDSYLFHVQQKPSLLIEPPSEKSKTVADESEFFFCPVSDDAGNSVWISGSNGDERLDNIGKMVSGLCRPLAHGKPLIEQFQDYLIKNVGSDRKNLLLVTNSYAEAKTFYNCLKPPYKDKASFVVRDGDSVLWTPDVNVPRSKMTEFPSQEKELLIAPMGAISRAVNLMHPDTGEPYFGGMVILVRQHPRPDDNQLIISAVNKATIDNKGSQPVEHIQRLARHTRDMFLTVPQIFSQLPDEMQGVAMKQPLVWTLAVNLTQLIGRSTRGGRKTVVWFTDAAFMPETAKGNRAGDTEKNSLLLAVRQLLGDAIKKGGSSGRLIKTLYGPVYYPLTRLTNFNSGANL